jgi:predicted Rossmann fold flavoprotein
MDENEGFGMHDWDVVVVGGGAAGTVAAFRAAERGRRTLLLEKNGKLGAKILISGGTRCNLSHATDRRGIAGEFGSAGPFLHSALSRLGPEEVVALFAAEGVATKVERDTGKVFPAGDRASDVVAALGRRLRRSGCALAFDEPLLRLERSPDAFRLATAHRTLTADRVILATGGKSHPRCGTTGDGYAWAESLGHSIVTPRPALVPLRTDAAWVRALQGITLPDVAVRVMPADAAGSAPEGGSPQGKIAALAQRRGSLLFAHFGLSGPVALDVSRAVSGHARPESLALVCDFLPDLYADRLLAMFYEACATAGKRRATTILGGWLPARLAESLVARLGLPETRPAAELSKADRRRTVVAMKHCAIPLSGTLGFQKAEVTAGGVALGEVDSRSMQSKIVAGLHFAGELLDLDGPIGGYNFQAAFSTGWLAGESAG